MDHIHHNAVRQRIDLAHDILAGSQMTEKGFRKYVGALSKAIGEKDASIGTSDDFKKDFGMGI